MIKITPEVIRNELRNKGLRPEQEDEIVAHVLQFLTQESLPANSLASKYRLRVGDRVVVVREALWEIAKGLADILVAVITIPMNVFLCSYQIAKSVGDIIAAIRENTHKLDDTEWEVYYAVYRLRRRDWKTYPPREQICKTLSHLPTSSVHDALDAMVRDKRVLIEPERGRFWLNVVL